VALAISTFGEGSSEGIARVNEINGVLAQERPDVLFDVAANVGENTSEELESARPLHRLRGFSLYCEREGRAPTVEEAEAGYPLLEQLYDGKIGTEWYPHFVDHSDSDGYYVPADFPKPVNSFVDGEVMSIGSAHRLLAEMNSIERFMTAAVASHAEAFTLENRAWSVLRAAAKHAVEKSLVVRFRTTGEFD
jgi:hypothetical protein